MQYLGKLMSFLLTIPAPFIGETLIRELFVRDWQLELIALTGPLPEKEEGGREARADVFTFSFFRKKDRMRVSPATE